MNPTSSRKDAEPPVVSRSVRLTAGLFALAAAVIFFSFCFTHPVDWLQPETLRLRYYGLQAGLRAGPLSASLNRYDLEKPLVWEAQGGMFDGRYPIMLLDALVPKFYQPFYSLLGPSLREPINLALIVLTWFFLFLLVREWCGSPPAALVAASFWLLTSQTLLDAQYPIRPNMALLTFLAVFIFWELVRLRRLRKGGFCLFRVGIALTAAAFTHEFGLTLVPLVWVLVALERRRLKHRIIPALTVGLVSWAIYLSALFWLLPPLAARVVGYPPPMDWMSGGLQSALVTPAIILTRIKDFVLVGIYWAFSNNLGAGENLSLTARLIGPAAAIVILIIGGRTSWRRAFPPLVLAVLNFLIIALFMFPVIPSTVEMPVYYHATIIVFFIPVLGNFLSGFSARPFMVWIVACLSLLIIGVLNFRNSDGILDRLPPAFGFNDRARRYTRDITSLPQARREAEVIPVPVYTAYPRPRVFDISRRWDIMLRVWHGEAEQVFSMMMPNLNLRLYERGLLIGDPEEFSVFNPSSPGEYEARAELYWDMPARRLIDLGRIRAAGGRFAPSPREWKNLDPGSSHPAAVRAGVSAGLLGNQPRVALPPGRWSAEIVSPPGFADAAGTLVFFLRADLAPAGPDDVMDRVTPLPLRNCRITVKAEDGRETFSAAQTFGWSYQFFDLIIPAAPGAEWELEVDSEADFEIIGPVLVPSTAVAAWEPKGEDDIDINAVCGVWPR